MGYQQITIVGNLGRDAELKYTQGGVPLCNFTVAVNEWHGTGDNAHEEVTWFRVTAWRQLAESLAQYLVKGKEVLVVGKVKTRAYADSGGQPAATLELDAREIRLLGKKGDVSPQGDGEEMISTSAASAIPF